MEGLLSTGPTPCSLISCQRQSMAASHLMTFNISDSLTVETMCCVYRVECFRGLTSFRWLGSSCYQAIKVGEHCH